MKKVKSFLVILGLMLVMCATDTYAATGDYMVNWGNWDIFNPGKNDDDGQSSSQDNSQNNQPQKTEFDLKLKVGENVKVRDLINSREGLKYTISNANVLTKSSDSEYIIGVKDGNSDVVITTNSNVTYTIHVTVGNPNDNNKPDDNKPDDNDNNSIIDIFKPSKNEPTKEPTQEPAPTSTSVAEEESSESESTPVPIFNSNNKKEEARKDVSDNNFQLIVILVGIILILIFLCVVGFFGKDQIAAVINHFKNKKGGNDTKGGHYDKYDRMNSRRGNPGGRMEDDYRRGNPGGRMEDDYRRGNPGGRMVDDYRRGNPGGRMEDDYRRGNPGGRMEDDYRRGNPAGRMEDDYRRGNTAGRMDDDYRRGNSGGRMVDDFIEDDYDDQIEDGYDDQIEDDYMRGNLDNRMNDNFDRADQDEHEMFETKFKDDDKSLFGGKRLKESRRSFDDNNYFS